jgi:hypothetical protein
MPLQTYADYGGRVNPAANALEGLQAGLAISELGRRRAEAERNYLAQQQDLKLRERARIDAQNRFSQDLGLRKEVLGETKEYHKGLLGVQGEANRIRGIEAETSKKRAEIGGRNATIGDVNAGLRKQELTVEQQKQVAKVIGFWAAPINTDDPEKFKKSFLPAGASMAAALNKAGFPEMGEVVLAHVKVLSDNIPDSPETLQAVMEQVKSIKKMTKGEREQEKDPEGMTVSQAQKEVERLEGAEPGSEDYTRLQNALRVIDRASGGAVGGAAQAAAGLPEGVSEEDIQFTMQKYKVSRDEVLRRIQKGK